MTHRHAAAVLLLIILVIATIALCSCTISYTHKQAADGSVDKSLHGQLLQP